MIADDSALLLKIARAMVEKAGHTVSDAPNGKVAVEKARSSPPDVIVLDAEMPEMDGLEACKTLKSDPATRHIPLYIYTGHELGGPEEAAFKAAGANGCFTKPYKADVLVSLAPH